MRAERIAMSRNGFRWARTLGICTATAALVFAATTATAAPTPVITINPTQPGPAFLTNALGVSFESTDLTLPGFTKGNLAQYLKTLGSSTIRIGGNLED